MAINIPVKLVDLISIISNVIAPTGERTRTATAPSHAMPITLPTELTGSTPKMGWSDNPDKRYHYCMTPETEYLLIAILTICTGRLFTAATMHK
jgi:hypothetical protein